MTLARKPGRGVKSRGSTWEADIGPGVDQVVQGALVPGPYAIDTTGAVAGDGLEFDGTKYVPGDGGSLDNAVAATFPTAGATLDYVTADAALWSPDYFESGGLDTTGRLGDGVDVPRFYVYGKEIASEAQRVGGYVRIARAHLTSAATFWPRAAAGCALVVPLPDLHEGLLEFACYGDPKAFAVREGGSATNVCTFALVQRATVDVGLHCAAEITWSGAGNVAPTERCNVWHEGSDGTGAIATATGVMTAYTASDVTTRRYRIAMEGGGIRVSGLGTDGTTWTVLRARSNGLRRAAGGNSWALVACPTSSSSYNGGSPDLRVGLGNIVITGTRAPF